MYALRVQPSDGSSSRSSESIKSLVLDDEPKPPNRSLQHTTAEPSPPSWVTKIGSTMFNKIKVTPNDHPKTERPPQYSLPIKGQNELRIAISPLKGDDREDAKPVLTKAGSIGQSIDFIKVYCSPKKNVPSPKIKPTLDMTKLPVKSKPIAHIDESDEDDDDGDDVVECMRRSPSRTPNLRQKPPTKEILPTEVVPVLQSFFARPKLNPRAKSNSLQSIDKRIHRQEQYKRDLNRHDELRNAHAKSKLADVETQRIRIEAWKHQIKSRKRQRMLEVSRAKAILSERKQIEDSLLEASKKEWESQFEDDVQLLSAAFAKAKTNLDPTRPSTTAGSVLLEATTIIDRDRVLHNSHRAQTAPMNPLPNKKQNPTKLQPHQEHNEDNSRPNSSDQQTIDKDLSWINSSRTVYDTSIEPMGDVEELRDSL